MSPPVRPISINPSEYRKFIKTLSSPAYKWIQAVQAKPQRNTSAAKGTNINKEANPADHCFSFLEALAVLRAYGCCHSHLFFSMRITSSLDPGVVNGMRGLCSYAHAFLPAPTLAVLAKDAQDLQLAKQLQVEHSGSEELIAQIAEGKITFDRLICTPEMMQSLGKVAQILGPKGLMPNAKTETLTSNVEAAVKRARETSLFRVERGTSTVAMPIGPVNMHAEQLEQNFRALTSQVKAAWIAHPKPPSASKPAALAKIVAAWEIGLVSGEAGSGPLWSPLCKLKVTE
jgi:large subunit ribosomal protein L1